MNLLFVTPYYTPTSFGGIESQVQTFSQSLAHHHHCVVVAPTSGSDRLDFEAGVPVYRTRLVNPLADDSFGEDVSKEFFRTIIEREQIDQIIAHNLHQWAPSPTARGLLSTASDRQLPVHLRIHNFCHITESANLRTLGWRQFLCVSQCLAQHTARLGISQDRIKVVYPPIDTRLFCPKPNHDLRQAFSIPSDAVIALHASRIVGGFDTFDDKGIAPLLSMFSSVKKTHLVFAAAKPVVELEHEFKRNCHRIKELAAGFSLEGRVHVLSAPYQDMPAVYNGAQIFIMLSRLETFGRVYAEASACGLPVVGADVGGISEAIVDRATGFVVRDEEEALQRLEQLSKDAELRSRLGHAGVAHVKRNFSSDVVSSKLIQILAEERAPLEKRHVGAVHS